MQTAMKGDRMIRTATIAAAVVAGALALAPAAQATHPLPYSISHFHTCRPAVRSDSRVLANDATTCTLARTVERYMHTHEALALPFHLSGHRWFGHVEDRTRTSTRTSFSDFDTATQFYGDVYQWVLVTYRGQAS